MALQPYAFDLIGHCLQCPGRWGRSAAETTAIVKHELL